MKHWQIDDVAWDRFDPLKVEPAIVPLVKAAAVQVVHPVLGYRARGAGLARLVSGGRAGTGPGTRSCVRQGWWRRPRAQRLR